MPDPDRVARAAANLAAWHTACIRALGGCPSADASFWSFADEAPFLYLSGITLAPANVENHLSSIGALARQKRGSAFGVCDSWAQLDLRDAGFRVFQRAEWLWREPRDPHEPQRTGVVVESVDDADTLAEFEVAHHEGFAAPQLKELGVGGVFGRSLLDDPTVHLYMARVEGEPVGVAMACVAAGCVGVYAVTTLGAYRRRGYGRSLTAAAAAADASLPAVLQPSDEGLSLYRRMRFQPLGAFTTWLRS